MRKLILFLLLSTSFTYSQSLIQTWVDRCTGEVKTFSISMTGYTTVVFYNKVGQFTATDVQSGALKIWMEETYYWWSQLSPCSTNQATSTAAQNTATNTASSAAAAAAAAPNTGTNGTSTSNTSTNTNSNSSSSNSSSSSENSSGNSQGGSEGGGESKTESKSTESESKESKSEESESSSEESSSEESSEESSEGEGGDDEDDSNDGEESEEEDKVDKKEKKIRPPINVAANMAFMSGLDGSLSQVASFGFSQSSLTGSTTYSANLMVWGNLQQFSLALGKSNIVFNYDREVKNYLLNPFTNKKDLYLNSDYLPGSIQKIHSISINAMYLFGTRVVTFGYSDVYLGQKDNMWKGFVGGFALSSTIINIDVTAVLTPSLVVFGTKPYNVGRIIVSPMIALASNPLTYSFEINQPGKGEIIWNQYITYIIGSNFDFNLTQRFKANIGGTLIGSTQSGIPLTYAITIGSKFQF